MNPPKDPYGTGHFVNWCKQLLRYIKSLRPMDSPDIKIVQHTIGWSAVLKRRGGGPGGTAGMNFKGEWSDTATYSVQDVVKISYGITAGCYIKTASGPAGTNPSEGGTWAKIGNVIDQQTWV